jgi:tRNA (mo5U34)-methyltransferase
MTFRFHTLHIQDQIYPGLKSEALLSQEWQRMAIDVNDKEVLDIGAWDGYFTFRAEHEGARRVVAMDHFVWSLDLDAQQALWNEARATGKPLPRYDRSPKLWQPHGLPGKRNFDEAHRRLGSHAEQIIADFMTVDPIEVGNFDIVFFLGVLYHLQDPLGGLKRVSLFTRNTAIIETEAVYIHGMENRPLLEFFPNDELNHDPSNWFAPNLAAVRGMCVSAGFRDFQVTAGFPEDWLKEDMVPGTLRRYRLTGHARKG